MAYDSAQSAADSAKRDIDRMMEEVLAARAELAKLKNEVGEGGILAMKPYPYDGSKASVKDYRTPSAARSELTELFELSKSIGEENKQAAAHNLQVLEKLKAIIAAMGIPTTVRRRKPKSRSWATETVTCDWFAEMQMAFPLSDGWQRIEDRHKEKLEAIAQWEKQDEAAKRTAQLQREEQERKDKYTRLAASMATRYGLTPIAEPDDVFNAVLEADKYLRLAYWLQRNRGDWNEGPHYASVGLRTFTEEDDRDRAVVECVSGDIDDWCGDGRIFRDNEWNYGRLFEIAGERNPQAMADYTALSEVKPLDY